MTGTGLLLLAALMLAGGVSLADLGGGTAALKRPKDGLPPGNGVRTTGSAIEAHSRVRRARYVPYLQSMSASSLLVA